MNVGDLEPGDPMMSAHPDVSSNTDAASAYSAATGSAKRNISV